jgi:signal transduction histidine kinase
MKILAQVASLILLDFQEVANGVKTHQATIFLLSVFVTGFSSFILWMAFRRIKSEKWMKYFAWTFGLLTLQYLILFLIWYSEAHAGGPPAQAGGSPSSSIGTHFLTSIVLLLLSLANTLCGITAARDLENKKTLLPRWCLVLGVGVLVTTVAGYGLSANQTATNQPFYQFLGRSLNSLLSAYCLFLIGYAIFANLSFRRHRLVAAIALFIASIYAIVQLVYGLSPLIAGYIVGADPAESIKLFDMFLVAIALPLKLILCVSAYLLVIRFFETLNELTNLQDRGIDGRQDYLSSEGFVKLIGEKLIAAWADLEPLLGSDKSGQGFVNLTVKLPGQKHKRVACILWPSTNPEGRVEVLDWDGRTTFSRLRSNQDPGKRKKPEWEKALHFVGEVLTEEGKKLFPWLNNKNNPHPGGAERPQMKAIVSVAIETHGAAIGCLQVARSTSPFSQMAIRQIREIANLVSPAVQAYRELAALDQMSIRFAEMQAKEMTYSSQESANLIADILYNIFASIALRLHLDFGFTPLDPIYKGNERVIRDIKNKVLFDDWGAVPTEFVDQGIVSYQFLKKQLTARLRETVNANESLEPTEDRFILGNLIVVVNENNDSYDHPALGTNYLHRRAASTLAADAYLDFQRDFYGALLKKLSKELSQQQLGVEEGFEVMKSTIRAAGLSWVVAVQKGRKGKLGDEKVLVALQGLGQITASKKEVVVGEIEITHYGLSREQENSNHVLKIKLPSSEGILWLGVPRKRFGAELDFSSPWRTFLVSLAQISDAALSRIHFAEKIQKNQVEAAQFQGFASAVVTTGTIIHQLSNLIQGQSSSISTLLDALKINRLTAKGQDLEQIMYAMDSSADKMQELINIFNSIIKSDERRPCRLIEAAQRAQKLFEVSLLQRGISLNIDVSEDVWLDIPFNVAALALANLVGNAKDAVDTGGTIRIESDANAAAAGGPVLCRVIDNGRGVAPELRGRLFQLGATGKEHGTGLGLYLTMRSLRENGAHVELTKTDEQGSVFTIRFPKPKQNGTGPH